MARTARSISEIKAKKELNDLLPQERKLRMKYRFTNIRTKYINNKIPMKKKYYDKSYAFFNSFPEGTEYARELKKFYDNQDSAVEPEEEFQYKGRGGGKGVHKTPSRGKGGKGLGKLSSRKKTLDRHRMKTPNTMPKNESESDYDSGEESDETPLDKRKVRKEVSIIKDNNIEIEENSNKITHAVQNLFRFL